MALLLRLERKLLNPCSRSKRTGNSNLLGNPQATPDVRELKPLTSFRVNVISPPLFNSTLKLHSDSL